MDRTGEHGRPQAPSLAGDGPAYGAGLRRHFAFAPGTVPLNHGSFGAVPRAVAAAADRWRRRFEGAPTTWYDARWPGLVRAVAGRVARELGVRDGALAFVENATAGVNAVLASLPLRPGDVVVVLDQAYPAVRLAAETWAARRGATVRVAALPFPPEDEDGLVAAVAGALDERVRLVVLDHVCSATGIVLPVARLVAACREAGARVLVDGAHAPGMLPLDLEALGADWSTGNLHKWMWAPRGCAVLHAAPWAREGLLPAVISLRAEAGYPVAFDWVGTRDVSPWLAADAALAFHRWVRPEVARAWSHRLAVEGARRLAAAWGTSAPVPERFCGSMAIVELPVAGPADPDRARDLRRRLAVEHGLVCQVLPHAGRLWLRLSGQVYLEMSDLDRLEEVVKRW